MERCFPRARRGVQRPGPGSRMGDAESGLQSDREGWEEPRMAWGRAGRRHHSFHNCLRKLQIRCLRQQHTGWL